MGLRGFFGSETARRSFCLSRRLRYLDYLNEGYSLLEAAKLAGVHKRTAQAWRHGRGKVSGKKVPPSLPSFYNNGMNKPKECNPKFFTLEERIEIHSLLRQGYSHRTIAKKLNRHHSAVSREIRKNIDSSGIYYPSAAHDNFLRRLARPKKFKTDKNPSLLLCILSKLELYWSPMQISKYLSETNKGDQSMQLSHESIYRTIYIQGKGLLKENLRKLMRQGRTGRLPRSRRGASSSSRFRDPMVNISQRPAEANDRAIPGHWEGDLIVGKGGKTAIGTLVERSTRYCVLLHLPNGHTADAVQKEVVRKMKNLPEHLRKTLAWDQGNELALHAKISKELDMQVYFCDPHSPWQRGTNENTNGLLRQYFPKGTDLSVYSDEDLDNAAISLNNRPRMTLGWKTPAQKFLDFQNKQI